MWIRVFLAWPQQKPTEKLRVSVFGQRVWAHQYCALLSADCCYFESKVSTKKAGLLAAIKLRYITFNLRLDCVELDL